MATYIKIRNGKVWSIEEHEKPPIVIATYDKWIEDTGFQVDDVDPVSAEPIKRSVSLNDIYNGATFTAPIKPTIYDTSTMTDADFRRLVLKKLGYAIKE